MQSPRGNVIKVLRQVLEAFEFHTKELRFILHSMVLEEERNLIWTRLLENNVGNNLSQMQWRRRSQVKND